MFRSPGYAAWAEHLRQEQRDAATAHFLNEDGTADEKRIGREAKARFLNYFQPLAIDHVDAHDRTMTSDGMLWVFRYSMEKAGVPKLVIDRAINDGDPMIIREIVGTLTRAKTVVAAMEAETERADPLPEPTPTSAGSPETGPPSTPGSEAPTS